MRPPSPFAPEPERGWELPCARQGCGGVAGWHVLWSADGEVSVLCTAHMDDAGAGYAFTAHHQLSLGCRQADRVWGDRACTAPVWADPEVVDSEWHGEDMDAVYVPGEGVVERLEPAPEPEPSRDPLDGHIVTVTTRTRTVPATQPTTPSQSWWACSCGEKDADPYGADSAREAERRGQDHLRRVVRMGGHGEDG